MQYNYFTSHREDSEICLIPVESCARSERQIGPKFEKNWEKKKRIDQMNISSRFYGTWICFFFMQTVSYIFTF